jgi:uncharacterized protein YicC (UPF0701 family)
MKTKNILTSVTACLIAVSFTACDKKTGTDTVTTATNAAATTMDAAKDMAGKAVETAKDATAKAVDTAKDAAGKATEAVKDTAAKATDAVKDAVAQVKEAVPNAADATTAKFTEVVAAAKKSISEKNYQGALDELKKLSDLKLSDEQTKVVDGLKEQVSKLISSGTAGAVDAAKGLFGK